MITVDQGFIWTGHQQHQEYIWTFPGYEQAFKGRHTPPALGPFLAIFGYFWGLWRPPKNLSGPRKRPKHIATDVPWPYQTLIKFDQPVWSLQGDLWLKKVIFGHFWPLWRPMAPPRGLPGPGKTPKHIVPCVSWPDQTLIKVDQPFWCLQGG